MCAEQLSCRAKRATVLFDDFVHGSVGDDGTPVQPRRTIADSLHHVDVVRHEDDGLVLPKTVQHDLSGRLPELLIAYAEDFVTQQAEPASHSTRPGGRWRVGFQDSQIFGRARADVHFGGPDVRVAEPQGHLPDVRLWHAGSPSLWSDEALAALPACR